MESVEVMKIEEKAPICSDEDDEEKAVNGFQKSMDTETPVATENGSWKPQEDTKFDPALFPLAEDAIEDCVGNQFVERYKCHHCEKSYKNIRSLNQHFREVQVCRVCKMSLPSVEEFTSHILEDHTVGALCGVCMNSFRSRARLVEHVRTHTQLFIKKSDSSRSKKRNNAASRAAKAVCKLCHAELSPLSPHTCHANVCKVCRKPLRTRSEFEMHMMRLHCSDDVCQFCGSRLPDVQKLISHLKSHTSLRFPAFKCLKCEVRFNNAAKLDGHDCQPHGKRANDFSPKKGGDSFGSPHDKLGTFPTDKTSPNKKLENGVADEVGEENLKYHCDWCNERFKYVKDLKLHKTEQHSCRFCKKQLTSQIEFETHLMEAHSSKDECQFCLRKFVCTTALRTHLKTHTTIAHMLHQCKKCKLKFASIKEKARHVCLKFSCAFCKQKFLSGSAMQAHIVKEHPETPLLQCNGCSKLFPTKQALKRHILVKHTK